MHNPATAEQREFTDPDIALSMFICVIECGLFFNESEFVPVLFYCLFISVLEIQLSKCLAN